MEDDEEDEVEAERRA